MPSTNTTNLNVEKPATGEQVDTWGETVNDNMDLIDAVFTADGSGTSVGLQVGASKTLNATAGTLLLPAVNTPAQTADGSVVWDADSNLLTVGDGSSRKTMVDTDSTQTLTNKSISGPYLTAETGAQFGTSGASSVDFFGTPGQQTGASCIGIASGGTPQTVAGAHGQLYVHVDGSLRYRSPSGTTTILGAA